MVIGLLLLVMVVGVVLFAIGLVILGPRLSRGRTYADARKGSLVFQDKVAGTRPSDGQTVGSGMVSSKNTRFKDTRK
ncbi:MAG: hypothetical protein ACTSUO_09820 [Candidatus Thorarchaeota archaeon]